MRGIPVERAQRLLSADARFLFRVDADTFEEALAVFNIKMGWGPYKLEGEPQICPRGCGMIFYP